MTAETNLWQCLQVRVTTFHSSHRTDLNVAAIAPLLGTEPESIEVMPNELRRFEVATLGPGRLTFSSIVNRVDWVWQSIEEPDPPQIALGAPVDVLGQFLPLIENWIANQHDTIRIALGGLFVIPVGDRSEGYKRLDSLIDELTLDPDRTSEFLYQINRPTNEAFGDKIIKFNNIEKWSCRQVMREVMSFAVGYSQPIRHDPAIIATHASCELDINTDAQNVTVFSPASSVELLKRAAEKLLNFLESKR